MSNIEHSENSAKSAENGHGDAAGVYLPPNNGATLQHPDPMRPLSADLKPGETATLAELRARREAAASGDKPPSPDDGLTATERAILNSLPPGGEWLGLEGWLEPLPDDWNPAIIKLQSSGMIEWDEGFESIRRVGRLTDRDRTVLNALMSKPIPGIKVARRQWEYNANRAGILGETFVTAVEKLLGLGMVEQEDDFYRRIK